MYLDNFHIQLQENIRNNKDPCSKTYPPNRTPKEKCERFWKMANEINPNDLGFNFKESCSIIRIKERAKTHTCYKKEHIETQGWCPLEGTNGQNNMWGFCSPSCKYFSNKDGKTRVILLILQIV